MIRRVVALRVVKSEIILKILRDKLMNRSLTRCFIRIHR